MTTLTGAFPLLAQAVAKALRDLERADLAQQIEDAVVSRVTFDPSAGAAYVSVEPSRALNVVEANIIGVRHGETIVVETEFAALVDTDNFERVIGVEVLAPGVLEPDLRRRTRG